MMTRDPYRGLISAVSNTVNGMPVSAYHYTYDALGRVVSRDADTFGYNPCSELTSAAMGTNAYSYAYDGIGNALWTTNNSVGTAYYTNPLNQYTNIIRASAPPRELEYDLDGNLLNLPSPSGRGDGGEGWLCQWDGENRLLAVYSNAACVVSNAYDHQSRRVLKVTPVTTHTFLYDGWNLIQETIATATGITTNHYIWGKDLSGTLQGLPAATGTAQAGAGGVGGLVAVIQGRDGAPSRPFFPLYDNNGNITAYVDDTGTIVAEYRYDAFGNTIAQSGILANAFPHRFSTKYYDTETGLYYYGYRFYSPELMRWLNRDPIGEVGGVNLYTFCQNSSANGHDRLGMITRVGAPRFVVTQDGYINWAFQLSKTDNKCCEINVVHLIGKVNDDEHQIKFGGTIEFDPDGKGDGGSLYYENEFEIIHERPRLANILTQWDFDLNLSYIFADNPGIGGSWNVGTFIGYLIPVEICHYRTGKEIEFLGLRKYIKRGRNYRHDLFVTTHERGLINESLNDSFSHKKGYRKAVW